MYAGGVKQRKFLHVIHHLQAKKQVLGIASKKEVPGFPVRLVIPAILVDASIEYLGVTQVGVMDVPSNAVDVGWFMFGPRPGENGSAVIAGHVDEPTGKSGVFVHLDKLKKGDTIYIQDEKGMSLTFTVRESRIYDSGYAEEVFSVNDGIHLNLVTCDGLWDGAKKSYTQRLVIFADIMR